MRYPARKVQRVQIPVAGLGPIARFIVKNREAFTAAATTTAEAPAATRGRATEELTRLDLLREKWQTEIQDLTGPVPLEMPPVREVVHRIDLMDPKKVYRN